MPSKTHKRSTAPKQTTATKPTGHTVKRRPAATPARASQPHTGARSGTKTKPRPATKPPKAPALHTRTQPKKRVVSNTAARPRETPRAKRPEHRAIFTTKKSVMFTLDASAGRDVSISGTFNNWEPQAMAKGPDGLWRITLRLAPGMHEYRFLVDTQWRDDPNNPRKRPNEHGGVNSVCDVM